MLGRSVSAIDTPALLVDYVKLQNNLQKLQQACDEAEISLRPHIKAHKTPQVAQMQIRGGAIGVTCAKIAEAEAMAAGGIEDIFLANSFVGETKMLRLVALAKHVPILRVAVESEESARQLNDAFVAAGMTLEVIIECNIGTNRAGVAPGNAVTFAQMLSRYPALEIKGLMGYAGFSYDYRGKEAFAECAAREGEILSGIAGELAAAGFDMSVISGGSTPQAGLYAKGCGLTEVRCGTYCLYDYNQVDIGACSVDDIAASVLTSVVAVPGEDRVIIDAGTKALDQAVSDLTEGYGRVKGCKNGNVSKINDEHGYIDRKSIENDLRIGEKVEIYPPRICTCLNLYDVMYVIEDGHVRDIWEITARGANN